ncbi:conserved hypothetical protein [Neospora caninum Liverpool]|uniref:Uncharacterized protein n=1 Tax=Neospora caninum (strain Liverpool) TaxID=572307 RepID=F0VKN2_NEOCL|nr:conserved hypothetical protein [Neospora caninum Liverpool]CBZ54633.1 conserved hypothetical protein [Neospora caninum Liverpool]CEL69349.1 TPA: hypothetical protein BN1204_050610 [Neospora caninum Liverpool]|eukprot:XP_003884663.1 conserved hypothetical protein [Neospora caninum Liverpool]
MADVSGNPSGPPPLSTIFSGQRAGPPSPHGGCMRDEVEKEVFSPTAASHLSPSRPLGFSSLNVAANSTPDATRAAAELGVPPFQSRPPVIPQLRLGLQSPKPPEQLAERSAFSPHGPESPRVSPSLSASRLVNPGSGSLAASPHHAPQLERVSEGGSARRGDSSSTLSSRRLPLSPSKRRYEDTFCPSPSSVRALPGPRVWWALPVLGSTEVAPQSPAGSFSALRRPEDSPGFLPSCAHGEADGECRCLYAAVTQAFHDQMRTSAASQPLLAAIEQFADSSLLCRLEPIAAGSGFPRSPAVLSDVRRQHALVLFNPPSAWSPPEAFSIQNLVQVCAAVDSKQSEAELVDSLQRQLAAQQQRFDAILESDLTQGELKRELWRMQLLQMQDQGRLKKQTSKLAEALEACTALSLLTGGLAPSAATSRLPDGPPTPPAALSSPGLPQRPHSPRQVSQLVARLLCLLQEAVALGETTAAPTAGPGPSGTRGTDRPEGFPRREARDVGGGRPEAASSVPSSRAGRDASCAGLSPCGVAARDARGEGASARSFCGSSAGRGEKEDASLHERMQSQQPRACVPPLFGVGDVRNRNRGDGVPAFFPGSPVGGRGPESGDASRRSLSSFSSSSYCSSQSNITTYRGNLSGDEGSCPPSGRRAGSGASGLGNPAFVSTWKGRPAFVPRLNLTGDDSEEEEPERGPTEAGEAGGAPDPKPVGGTENGRLDAQGLALPQRQSDEEDGKSGSDMKEDFSELRDEEASQPPLGERRLDSDAYHQASQRGSVCASGLSSGEESQSSRVWVLGEKDGPERQASALTLSSACSCSSPSLCPETGGGQALSPGRFGAGRDANPAQPTDSRRVPGEQAKSRETLGAVWSLQQLLQQRQSQGSLHSGSSSFRMALGSPLDAPQIAAVAADSGAPAVDASVLAAGAEAKERHREQSGASLVLTPSSAGSSDARHGPTRGYSAGSSSVFSSFTEDVSRISSEMSASIAYDAAQTVFSRANSVLSPSSGAFAAAVGCAPASSSRQALANRDDGEAMDWQEETREEGAHAREVSRQPPVPRLKLGGSGDPGIPPQANACGREAGATASAEGVPETPSRDSGKECRRPPPLSCLEGKLAADETVGQLRWRDGRDSPVEAPGRASGFGASQPNAEAGALAASCLETNGGDENAKACLSSPPTLPASATGTERKESFTEAPAETRETERGAGRACSGRALRPSSPAVSVSSCSSPSVAELRRAFESGQMWGGGSATSSPVRTPSMPAASGPRRGSTGSWRFRRTGSSPQGGICASPVPLLSLPSVAGDPGTAAASPASGPRPHDSRAKGAGPTSEAKATRAPCPPYPAADSASAPGRGSETHRGFDSSGTESKRPAGEPHLVGGGEKRGDTGKSTSRREERGAREGPPSAGGAVKDGRVPAFSRGSLFPSHSEASCTDARSRGPNEPAGARDGEETQKVAAATSPNEPCGDRQGEIRRSDCLEGLEREGSQSSHYALQNGDQQQENELETEAKATDRSRHSVSSPGSTGPRLSSSHSSGSPPSSPLRSLQCQQPPLGVAEKDARTELPAGTNPRGAGGEGLEGSVPSGSPPLPSEEKRNKSQSEAGRDSAWNEGSEPSPEKPNGAGEARETTSIAFPACVAMTYDGSNASLSGCPTAGGFIDAQQRSEELRSLGVDPALVFPHQPGKRLFSEVEDKNVSRLVTGDFAAAEDGYEVMDLGETGESAQEGDLDHEVEKPELHFWGVETPDGCEKVAYGWSAPVPHQSPLSRPLLPGKTGTASQQHWADRAAVWSRGTEDMRPQETVRGDEERLGGWGAPGAAGKPEAAGAGSSSQSLFGEGRPLEEPLRAASFVVKTDVRSPFPPAPEAHAGAPLLESSGGSGAAGDLSFTGGFDACDGAEAATQEAARSAHARTAGSREAGEEPGALAGLLATTAPEAASDAPGFERPSSFGSTCALTYRAPPEAGALGVTEGATAREDARARGSLGSGASVPMERLVHGVSLHLCRDGDGIRHRSPPESGYSPFPEVLNGRTGVHDAGQGAREAAEHRRAASLETQAPTWDGSAVSGHAPAVSNPGWRLATGGEGRRVEQQRVAERPRTGTGSATAWKPEQATPVRGTSTHATPGPRCVSSSALLSALLNPPFDPIPADLHLLLASASSESGSLNAESELSSLSASESSTLSLPLQERSTGAAHAGVPLSPPNLPLDVKRETFPTKEATLANLLPLSRCERGQERSVSATAPLPAEDFPGAHQADAFQRQQGAFASLERQAEPYRGATVSPQTQISGLSVPWSSSPGTATGENPRSGPRQFMDHARLPRPAQVVPVVPGQPADGDRPVPSGLGLDAPPGLQGASQGVEQLVYGTGSETGRGLFAPVSLLAQAANPLHFPQATQRPSVPQTGFSELTGFRQTSCAALGGAGGVLRGGPQTAGRVETLSHLGLRGAPDFPGGVRGESAGGRGTGSRACQGLPAPLRRAPAGFPQPFPFRTMSQQQVQENLQRQILLTASRGELIGAPRGNAHLSPVAGNPAGTERTETERRAGAAPGRTLEFRDPGQQAQTGLTHAAAGGRGDSGGAWRNLVLPQEPQSLARAQLLQQQLLLQRPMERTQVSRLAGQVTPGDHRGDVNRQGTGTGGEGGRATAARQPGQGAC